MKASVQTSYLNLIPEVSLAELARKSNREGRKSKWTTASSRDHTVEKEMEMELKQYVLAKYQHVWYAASLCSLSLHLILEASTHRRNWIAGQITMQSKFGIKISGGYKTRVSRDATVEWRQHLAAGSTVHGIDRVSSVRAIPKLYTLGFSHQPQLSCLLIGRRIQQMVRERRNHCQHPYRTAVITPFGVVR
jgi:hypothetical protein